MYVQIYLYLCALNYCKMERKANNYCVIMAGGVGSRFWPYSRNSKPKQFLDFFGTGKSLIQMTVERFLPLVPMENIIVVTNAQYVDIVREQLPELKPEQILAEPARRNTAPCIAWAVEYIAEQCDREAVGANIIVAPSDHIILNEKEFVRVIREGLEFTKDRDVLLTLGMKPTRPETGYGYIQYLNEPIEDLKLKIEDLKIEDLGIYPVKRFTEKPDLETAKAFVASGDYYWNSGMFIWNSSAIKKAINKYLPEVARVFANGEPFENCPSVSIDYGVMEKADNVYVLPADFGWSDLGTWGSLYVMNRKDESGNVSLHSEAHFYNSHGNIVTLEHGKMAVISGLQDMIVAEENGVLLICPLRDEQQIKEYVNNLNEKYK